MTSLTSAFIPFCFVAGVAHTLFGPDHYLPLAILARIENWSARRLLVISFMAGILHLAFALAIGLAAIALGAQLPWLQRVDSVRGTAITIAMLLAGLIYVIWTVRRKGNPTAMNALRQQHLPISMPRMIIALIIIGPCEPLLPLLYLESVRSFSPLGIAGLLAFCLGTLPAMSLAALAVRAGLFRFTARTRNPS